MSPAESHAFTAAACQFAADAWEGSDSEAQRDFAPVLAKWAANALARAAQAERNEQPDLFAA